MTKEAVRTPRIIPAEDAADRAWLTERWRRLWSGETMVSRGRLHRLDELHGLIAIQGDRRIGSATYHLGADDCELTSLDVDTPGRGYGSMLLAAVEDAARRAGKRRLWLITTNDNVDALRFYQRRGYRLKALHPGAVDAARHLKPAIPLVGAHGIEIHDEIELEKPLD